MILATESYRMLSGLFDVSMAASARVAASASSGIGKTFAAEAFVAQHPDRCTLWRPVDGVKICPALTDLLIANLPEPYKSMTLATGEVPDIRQLTWRVNSRSDAPARFLVIIDDVQNITSHTLKQIVADVIEAGKDLNIGLVLLGNEYLSLPSNALPSRFHKKMKSLEEVEEHIVMGPTLTTRSLTGEDVVLIAESFGATRIEAANLRDLHNAGRIDATFPEIKRLLRTSRKVTRRRADNLTPSGGKSGVAPIC